MNAPPPFEPELRLALAGGVSAGAYLAGALDALLQVLDALPHSELPYRIRVSTLAGSSAGALSATLWAAALALPHRPGEGVLAQAWIDDTDAADLLGLRDAASQPRPSLLDALHIDWVSERALTHEGALQRRAWVDERLRLRSVVLRLDGGGGEVLERSASYGPVTPPATLDFGLQAAQRWQQGGAELAAAARASGAFPVLLSPQPVALGAPVCAVDGGLLRGLPVDAAGYDAQPGPQRCVLLISLDPSDAAAPPAPSPVTWRGLFGALLGALGSQLQRSPLAPPAVNTALPTGLARRDFGPAQLPGAQRPVGTQLGGFAGYFDARWRRHDFKLGRAHMLRWLEGLSLQAPAGQGAHPAWPLRPSAAGVAAETEPAWPVDQADLPRLHGPLRRRLGLLLARHVHPLAQPLAGQLGHLLLILARRRLEAAGLLSPQPAPWRWLKKLLLAPLLVLLLPPLFSLLMLGLMLRD